MSIGDFKSLIKNRFYDKKLLIDALDIWRNCTEFKDINFKEEFPLERYTSCPLIFCHDIISKFVDLAREKYDVPSSKSEYGIVKETNEWILINPVNANSFKYMAHKYLRQKDDEEQFGVGPRWCIASSSRANYWNRYCKTTPSPLSYILFSKSDSTKRVAIVFDKIGDNVEDEDNFSYKDELIQRIEMGDSIPEMSDEVRLMVDNESYPEEALDYIEKNFGIDEDDIKEDIYHYLINDFDNIVDSEDTEEIPHFKQLFESYEDVIKEDSRNLYDIMSHQYKHQGISFKDIPWMYFLKGVHNGDYASSTYRNLFEILIERVDFREEEHLHQIFYEELLCMVIGIGEIRFHNFSDKYLYRREIAKINSKANQIIRNKKLEQLARNSQIKKTPSSLNLVNYLQNLSRDTEFSDIGKIVKDVADNITFSDEKFTPNDFYREFKILKYAEEWDGYGRFNDGTAKSLINTVLDICPQKEEFFYTDILNDFYKTIGGFFNDEKLTIQVISTWWGILGYDFNVKRLGEWAEKVLKEKNNIRNHNSLKTDLLSVVYLNHLRPYSGNELCEKYIKLKKELRDNTNYPPFSGDFKNLLSHYTDIYEKNETILENIEKYQKEEFLQKAEEDISLIAKRYVAYIEIEISNKDNISQKEWKDHLQYWSKNMNADFGLTRKYEPEKAKCNYFVAEIFKKLTEYYEGSYPELLELLKKYSNENNTWDIEKYMFGWNY